MKIEILKYKDGRYALKIENEIVLVNDKLSSIVAKIEQYVKLRYLAEEQKGGLQGLFQKVMTGK